MTRAFEFCIPTLGNEVQLYAFGIMTLDGDDLQDLPLTNLARLLARHLDGIFAAPFEQVRSGLISLGPPAISGWRA